MLKYSETTDETKLKKLICFNITMGIVLMRFEKDKTEDYYRDFMLFMEYHHDDIVPKNDNFNEMARATYRAYEWFKGRGYTISIMPNPMLGIIDRQLAKLFIIFYKNTLNMEVLTWK